MFRKAKKRNTRSIQIPESKTKGKRDIKAVLAARCNFGIVTESLAKDDFIVNMNNKEVQQKLCTEPKDTIAKTIQLAISYEEGAMRQQSFDKVDKPNIKAEPNEINISIGTKRW